jgi:hypothetical protein
MARATARSGHTRASSVKNCRVVGVTKVGGRHSPIAASARPSRNTAFPASGTEACPPGPRAVTVTTCDTFSALCTAT